MLPNAFASNYIKSGWNVWITGLDIKFGFRSGYTQWPGLMCVFPSKGSKIMEIIAFFIFFNDQYEKMNPKIIFLLCARLKKKEKPFMFSSLPHCNHGSCWLRSIIRIIFLLWCDTVLLQNTRNVLWSLKFYPTLGHAKKAGIIYSWQCSK